MIKKNDSLQVIKKTFIELSLQVGALKFGDFTLKSGRQSPYFFNAGNFDSGAELKTLGELYAETLMIHSVPCQHLFGPAYKGIPIATTTAIALSTYGHTTHLTFNRKEIKTHGEGGMLVGADIQGKEVVMIDDVITRGTAFRESKSCIESHGAKLTHVIIALDREEKGTAALSTLEEIKSEGIEVISIIQFQDLLAYVTQKNDRTLLTSLEAYRQTYGVSK